MSPSDPLREALRGVLCAAVKSEPGAAGGIGSIQCRVFATLYALLGAHSVDRRGRCLLCRRTGAVLGFRRRHCRVHGEASGWLQQPEWFVRSRLVSELGLTDLPPAQGSATPTAAGDLGDTDVVPGIEPEPRRVPSLDASWQVAGDHRRHPMAMVSQDADPAALVRAAAVRWQLAAPASEGWRTVAVMKPAPRTASSPSGIAASAPRVTVMPGPGRGAPGP